MKPHKLPVALELRRLGVGHRLRITVDAEATEFQGPWIAPELRPRLSSRLVYWNGRRAMRLAASRRHWERRRLACIFTQGAGEESFLLVSDATQDGSHTESSVTRRTS